MAAARRSGAQVEPELRTAAATLGAIRVVAVIKRGDSVLLVRRPLAPQWASPIGPTGTSGVLVDERDRIRCLVGERTLGRNVAGATGFLTGLVPESDVPHGISLWHDRLAKLIMPFVGTAIATACRESRFRLFSWRAPGLCVPVIIAAMHVSDDSSSALADVGKTVRELRALTVQHFTFGVSIDALTQALVEVRTGHGWEVAHPSTTIAFASDDADRVGAEGGSKSRSGIGTAARASTRHSELLDRLRIGLGDYAPANSFYKWGGDQAADATWTPLSALPDDLEPAAEVALGHLDASKWETFGTFPSVCPSGGDTGRMICWPTNDAAAEICRWAEQVLTGEQVRILNEAPLVVVQQSPGGLGSVTVKGGYQKTLAALGPGQLIESFVLAKIVAPRCGDVPRAWRIIENARARKVPDMTAPGFGTWMPPLSHVDAIFNDLKRLSPPRPPPEVVRARAETSSAWNCRGGSPPAATAMPAASGAGAGEAGDSRMLFLRHRLGKDDQCGWEEIVLEL